MDFKKIFRMSDRTYDILKWVFLRIYPAIMTMYGVIAVACKIPYTEVTLTIMGAVLTAITTSLGISSELYKKEVSNEDN